MRTWIGDYVCGVCGGGTEVERVFSTLSADGGRKNAFRGTFLLTVVLGRSYFAQQVVIPQDGVPFASDPVVLPTGQRGRRSKRGLGWSWASKSLSEIRPTPDRAATKHAAMGAC